MAMVALDLRCMRSGWLFPINQPSVPVGLGDRAVGQDRVARHDLAPVTARRGVIDTCNGSLLHSTAVHFLLALWLTG